MMNMAPTTLPLAAEIASLLLPVPGAEPAGDSLRYEAVFAQIREARMEDDSTLPLGDWERPLKKADWRMVQRLSTQTLLERSKDLQIACWLIESWVWQRGLTGLTAGAQLLTGMLQEFWSCVHPAMDDGDLESRAAPLDWINAQLDQVVRLHVPLFPFVDKQPAFISVNDWQQAVAVEFGGNKNIRDAEEQIPRQVILDAADQYLSRLAKMDSEVVQARNAWQSLSNLVNEKFNNNTPGFSKIDAALALMQQSLRSLLHNRDPRTSEPEEIHRPSDNVAEVVNYLQPSFLGKSENSGCENDLNKTMHIPENINSRAEAYKLLEMIAVFLEKNEPHSPTPYLIKRAVTWGKMPLPELMKEVLREEGDFNRYFSMLGLKFE